MFVLQAHDDVSPAVDYHGSIFWAVARLELRGEYFERGDLPCAHAGKAKQRKAGVET